MLHWVNKLGRKWICYDFLPGGGLEYTSHNTPFTEMAGVIVYQS